MPRSLWAAVTPDARSRPPLQSKREFDVVIIGAGFMGLSAALHLAEGGASVGVVEAACVGWGASGRNNGLVAPGLKRDPEEVRKVLGRDAGDRLLRLSGDAPGEVFQLIERHAIECDANRRGWIQAAHAPAALSTIEKRVRDWAELDADVAMIAPDDVERRLGTDYYVGAWVDRRGGSLNPLGFVRGLASAAEESGAEIFEASPVIGIEQRGTRWRALTPGGSIDGDAILCCTNAYNDGIDRIRGTVIPVRTAQVATAPLSDAQCAGILPAANRLPIPIAC